MTSTPALLVATDFSAPARQAADRAALIARAASAPLHLVHVMPAELLAQLNAWLGSDGRFTAPLLADAQAQLQQEADRLQPSGAQAASPLLRQGQALQELLQAAEAVDAGLLVLGARGAGRLRRLLIGSTAERLARKTQRPLLVVRQPARAAYQRVLVSLDFSPWSAGTLQAALRVAPQARLVLAHVFQVPYEDKLRLAGVEESTVALYRETARAQATQRLHALAAAAGLPPERWEARVVEGDAAFSLVEMEQDCDLAVVGKHGSSLATDLFLGSVTHHLLAEGGSDLLISTQRDGG